MTTMKPPFWKVLDNGIGADFVLEASIESGTFPLGTTARIEVYEEDETTVLDTWNGTYDTTSFSWYETNTTANAIPDQARYRAYVVFPDTSENFLWFFGTLRRIG